MPRWEWKASCGRSSGLHRAEGMGVKAITQRMGVARNTVRAALRSEAPPRYERAPRGSIVDAVEPEIRKLLTEFPGMSASVIAERIGWGRGITVLRDRIAELRPLFLPPDPSQRTWYRPGQLAQFDLWQPEAEIPVGFGQTTKLWTVVGVAGFSRLIGAHMVPSRAAHDVLAGMLSVLGHFGGVPRKAVWDQEGCIGAWRGGRQVLTAEFQAFRGTLGDGSPPRGNLRGNRKLNHALHMTASVAGVSGILCKWVASVMSDDGESSGEIDGYGVEAGLPSQSSGAGVTSSLGGDVTSCEVEQLEGCSFVRKVPAVLGDLTQLVVDRLDGVGGVDHSTDL